MEFASKKEEKYFLIDIASSITRSCNLAFKVCKQLGNNVQEPDIVAHIIKQLPNDLHNALLAYCSIFDFGIVGVYCHQKPLADFGSKPCPEIGDLLLVYLEEDDTGRVKCNALLLQAKMVKGSIHKISLDEAHQLRLYKEWPSFEYVRAGNLNGVKRDINPKSINLGAKYLMFKKPYNNEKFIGCAIPGDNIEFSEKISDCILRLLKFSTGRTFDYKHPVEDDWTNMIWDLMGIAYNKKFRRTNSGISNDDRTFIQVCGNDLDMIFNSLRDKYCETDEDGAVPMVLIKGKYRIKSE